MTSTVIFNDFKAPTLWRSRFRRSEYELWDANIHHGDVRPFACPELLCEEYGLRSLYPLRDCDCVLLDRYDTHHIKGFCKDQHFYLRDGKLLHITSDELCEDASGNVDYAGSPTPWPPRTVENGGCSEEACDVVGVSYVLTYLVEHAGIQIESAPSNPTMPISCEGDVPNVTLTFDLPTAILNNYSLVSMRLYRTESTFEDGTDSMSPNGSEYVFVDELPIGTTDYVDTIPSIETGGPLTTYDPSAFPAPSRDLKALVRTADGIAVADNNRVYISLPGQPQFTFDGVVEIEDTIEDMAAIGNTIFVFTDNKPVKIGFRHTDGVMSIDRQVVERRLPLKSVRSVSAYGNKVYFSTTHSLYGWDIGGYGSDIRSDITPLLTPEQWKNLDPSSIIGTAYEFGYIFSSNTIEYSLMVEFGGDGTDTSNGISIIPISYIKDPSGFALDHDGHIIYSDSTGTYRWDWMRDTGTQININDNLIPGGRNCQCCPWTLKMYFDNEGKNRFSKMRIEWDERSATHLDAKFYLKAFGAEELLAEFEVTSSRGFSTPKYCSSQTVCVEVSGCGIMHEIRLATSNQELVSNSNNLIGNPGEQ